MGQVVRAQLAALPEPLQFYQGCREAAGEHELGVFAAFDSGLDECHELRGSQLEALLREERVHRPQLLGSEPEGRLHWSGLARRSCAEVALEGLVVAGREDVVSPWPQVTELGEEL